MLIAGMLLHPWPDLSSYTPWTLKSLVWYHRQFYLEPQAPGHSVPLAPTIVYLDRENIGGASHTYPQKCTTFLLGRLCG